MRSFHYERAGDAAAAVGAAAGGQAAFLAGGTTLLDLMKLDVQRPAAVVDINGLADHYGSIEVTEQGLRLGALVRMSEAADHPAIRRDYPVVAQSLQLAASTQLRHMATLGGNVLQRTRCSYFRDPSWAACNKRAPGSGCAALEGVNRTHAVLGVSPHCIATYPGDFAQALVALDASAEIAGADGLRSLRVETLHLEPGATPQVETVLTAGDLIVAFEIPARPWTRRSIFRKVRDRESYEFALASAAVALDLVGETVREVRIALGGVATRPWRAREAEAVLAGGRFSVEKAEAAAATAFARAETQPGNSFKVELGRRCLVDALMTAAAMEI
jgi:xanthine dehydrogenase YagS FAD-binding subunit